MHKQTISILAALALFCGCPKAPAHGRTKATEKPDVVKQREDVLNDAAQKRAAWSSKVKAMNPAELAAELKSESEHGREPFNSMAFAEAVHRGEAGAPALAAAITTDDRSGTARQHSRRCVAHVAHVQHVGHASREVGVRCTDVGGRRRSRCSQAHAAAPGQAAGSDVGK